MPAGSQSRHLSFHPDLNEDLLGATGTTWQLAHFTSRPINPPSLTHVKTELGFGIAPAHSAS